MKTFIVERYEVHTQKVMVEAKDRAEAIKMVLKGEGTDVDNSLEYIESDENRGMPTQNLTKKEKEELSRCMDTDDEFIPTIRSVEEEG